MKVCNNPNKIKTNTSWALLKIMRQFGEVFFSMDNFKFNF